MFAIFSVPIADLRGFLPADTHRLAEPAWPRPALERSRFLRGFGKVRTRPHGGIDGWEGEGAYCGAIGAVKFHAVMGLPPLGLQTDELRFTSAYRRIFSDGRGMTRLDLGFRIRSAQRAVDLRANDLSSLVQHLFKIPITIRVAGVKHASQLSQIGPFLSASYLRASTRSKSLTASPPNSWWVLDGTPFLALEYNVDLDVVEPNDTYGAVHAFPLGKVQLTSAPELSSGSAENITTQGTTPASLHFARVLVSGRRLPVWLTPSVAPSSPHFQRLRRARLHLVRLHAQVECLQQVLGCLSSGRLSLTSETSRPNGASDRLERFLSDSFALLSRSSRDGLLHDPVFKALTDSLVPLAADEYQNTVRSLEHALSEAKRATRLRFRSLASSDIGRGTVLPGITVHANNARFFSEVVMSKQEISIGPGATVTNSILTQAGRDALIQSRHKQVDSSLAPEDVKAQVKSLQSVVLTGAAEAPAPDQEKNRLVRRLDDFAAEATAKAVDKSALRISADGLLEAAKAIAGIATPVAITVKAILSLLGLG